MKAQIKKTRNTLAVKSLTVIYGLSLYFIPAFGGEADRVKLDKEKEIKKPSPCLITVVTLLKSQDRYENSYPLDFKTEQECKKSAERHSTNFNPEVIEKVTSSYEWKKPK